MFIGVGRRRKSAYLSLFVSASGLDLAWALESLKQSLRGVRLSETDLATQGEFKAAVLQLENAPQRRRTSARSPIRGRHRTPALRDWISQVEIDYGERPTIEEREELRRLRKENKVLRVERENLK